MSPGRTQCLARKARRLDAQGLCTMFGALVRTPEQWGAHRQRLYGRACTFWMFLEQNRLHGRCGPLWQNRFFSCPMDEAHALQALCYVELNPVRAGMARKPWTYAWSSAAAHCGKGPAHPLLDLPAWRKDMPAETWRETVAERNAAAMDRIRLNTHAGRPLGSDNFLSKVEKLLGRRVRPLPVGRQRGWRKPGPEPLSARGGKG